MYLLHNYLLKFFLALRNYLVKLILLQKAPPSIEQGAQITASKPKDSSNTLKTEVPSKESEEGKSKAQLKAERRGKQEAQRMAKEAALAKAAAAKPNEQHPKVTQPSKEDPKDGVVKVMVLKFYPA